MRSCDGCARSKPAPPVARSLEIISSLLERDLDVDAGLLLELGDDVGGHVVGPGDEAQFVVLRDGGSPAWRRRRRRRRANGKSGLLASMNSFGGSPRPRRAGTGGRKHTPRRVCGAGRERAVVGTTDAPWPPGRLPRSGDVSSSPREQDRSIRIRRSGQRRHLSRQERGIGRWSVAGRWALRP